MTNPYDEAYQRSISDPDGFWGDAAKAIDWFTPATRVLNGDNPPYYCWFEGATCNTCYNAVDRHVEAGRGEQAAIIHDSPVTGGVVQKITYADLKRRVAAFAGALAEQGVKKGDRVIVYMPMVPEAVIAMLACARIGAVHCVVFGGFAANELAVRIDDATADCVVSASCGIEGSRVIEYKPLLDEAIELASHKPSRCIILQRPEATASMIDGRDIEWFDALAASSPVDCVPVEATDPLYILYTSGSTGVPKGVVRDNGGHMVALAWSMKNIYDCEPGDVYWAASDVGWVVGHSYIVYGPLLHGCTSIMFEGKPVGTPDAGAFWRVIQDHKVKVLFTAPTAFRAIKQQDPGGALVGDYDISSLKYLFLAGERTDPDTLAWAGDKLGVPVIDHWWQTETGWAIAGNCMGLHPFPVKPGSPTKAVPGWDVRILDEACNEVKDGDIGAICVKLPMAPSSLPTLWQNDQKFIETYMEEFPGYYKTADAGYKDEDGYLFIMARTDDIINVAGHRLSTGGMEEVIAAHPDVAECAVIGVADDLKGQLPVGFMVLNAGVDKPEEELVAGAVQMVRDRIGPVAAFKQAVVVKRLPKTRSGKILRGTMQKIADNVEYRMPATIDDPVILDEIREALERIGYAGARKHE